MDLPLQVWSLGFRGGSKADIVSDKSLWVPKFNGGLGRYERNVHLRVNTMSLAEQQEGPQQWIQDQQALRTPRPSTTLNALRPQPSVLTHTRFSPVSSGCH